MLIVIGSLLQPSKEIGITREVTPSPSSSPSREPALLEATATDVPTVAAPTATAPPAATPTHALAKPAPIALTVHITESTYGHVGATTTAGATCTAEAVLPSGSKSTAQGLQGSKVAGGDGTAAWDYKRGSNTKKGTGTHTVRCSLNGQTASDSAPFTVS